MIRRAKSKDDIISVLNVVFDTDFKIIMPKVYNYGYHNSHFVKEVDDNIVGVIGNLINDISFDTELYKYSIIGSLCVKEEYRNQGIMKELMNATIEENYDKNVVFSVLSGERNRYLHYDYEKVYGKINVEIDIDLVNSYFNNNITIKEYNDSLEDYYKLYCNNHPIKLRNIDNFIPSIYKCDYKLEDLSININPLQLNLLEKLKLIALEINYEDDINVRIYNVKRFLEFIINLNLKYKKIDNTNLVYKIDNEVIEISIVDNKCNVLYLTKTS